MAFPAIYNFNYYRGDTYTMEITAKDITGAEIQLGGPEGYQACFINIAKRRGGDENDYIAQIQATIDGTKILFTIPHETGSEFSSNTNYIYDVELQKTSTTNGVTTILQKYTVVTGAITVTDDVYVPPPLPVTPPEQGS